MYKAAFTNVEINNKTYLSYIVLDENRSIVDFELYEDRESTLLNNIYTARVDNIIRNINSAFVKISDNQNCYLSLNNNSSFVYTNKPSKKAELCIGDEILVQVTKEAVKTKDPVVSSKLSINGKYCIVTTENTTLGVSKKIRDDIRKPLVEALNFTYEDQSDRLFGIVIRTNAQETSTETVMKDVASTVSTMLEVINKGKASVYGQKIFAGQASCVLKAHSLNSNQIEEIVTDVDWLYEKLSNDSACICPIRQYNDSQVSLSTLYNLKGQIDKLINKKVNLKSGANIIIEQLETMTVIDINTGKNISKKDNVVLAVNKEAASEIARQLRLRNISGMIIVDFINLKDDAEKELCRFLREELKKDYVPCELIDVTKLGLFEITRKKVRKSLNDIISKKC